MSEVLGPPAALGVPSPPLQVPIAATIPGQTVDISVPLRVRNQLGTAEAYWKIVDGDGHKFSFSIDIPKGYSQRSSFGKERLLQKSVSWGDDSS